ERHIAGCDSRLEGAAEVDIAATAGEIAGKAGRGGAGVGRIGAALEAALGAGILAALAEVPRCIIGLEVRPHLGMPDRRGRGERQDYCNNLKYVHYNS